MATVLSDDIINEKLVNANKLQNNGNITEADRILNEVLEGDSKNTNAYYLLGISRAKQKDFQKAKEHFLKAIEMHNHNPHAWHDLGKIFFLEKDLVKAKSCYSNALKLIPDWVEALENLSKVLYHMFDFEAAEPVLRKLVGLSPDNSQAHNTLGAILYYKRQVDDAIYYFDQATKLDPNLSDAYDNLGCAQNDNGLHEESIENHIRALQTIIANPHIIEPKYITKDPMSQQNARQALFDVDDILSKAGVRYFLGFGTLLGLIRDGDFIPYDKDIDLCFMDDYTLENLYKILWPEGSLKEGRHIHGSVVHNNKIEIDLFVHSRKGDKITTGIDNPGIDLIWEFSDFSLIEKEFFGRKFLIPENYDKYLSEVYGQNWREPDTTFNTKVLAPNIVDKFNANHMTCTLNTLYDSLKNANFDKALRYCHFIKNGTNDNAQLFADIEKLIKNIH